jgi:hypothetical protein
MVNNKSGMRVGKGYLTGRGESEGAWVTRYSFAQKLTLTQARGAAVTRAKQWTFCRPGTNLVGPKRTRLGSGNTVLYETRAKQSLLCMNPVLNHWYTRQRSATKQCASKKAIRPGLCSEDAQLAPFTSTANNMTALYGNTQEALW